MTQRICQAANLPHAETWNAGRDVPTSATVIVKSDMEHASYGMDAKSVIDDLVVKLSQLNQDGTGIRDENALNNACTRLLDSTIKLSW